MVNGDSGRPGLHAVSHVRPEEPGTVTHPNLPTKESLVLDQTLSHRNAMVPGASGRPGHHAVLHVRRDRDAEKGCVTHLLLHVDYRIAREIGGRSTA